MANYTASNFAKAQAKLFGAFQASELRYRQPNVFNKLTGWAPIMFPESSQIRTREDRTVEAYFQRRTARALGNARSHNPTGAIGDSGVITPAWTIYADEFQNSLKRADNNVYSAQEVLNNEILNVVGNFAEGLDDAATEYLYNNRSQVNGVSLEGGFDGVTFVYELTKANVENRAVQITKRVMETLKYYGGMTFFCDGVSFNLFQFYANQGNGNQENTEFQYSGVTFVYAPELNGTAGYTNGFWLAVPDGTVAAIDWIPVQNRMGVETKEAFYGSLANPVDGLNYAIFSYEERADTTSTNGQTQDVKTETQISIDIALEHAPLSVANETTIQAFGFI